MVSYSSLILAGFTSHESFCADPGDSTLTAGVRMGLDPSHQPEEFRDLTLLWLVPAAQATAVGSAGQVSTEDWVASREGSKLHLLRSLSSSDPVIAACACGKQFISPLATGVALVDAVSLGRPLSPTCFSRASLRVQSLVSTSIQVLLPTAVRGL